MGHLRKEDKPKTLICMKIRVFTVVDCLYCPICARKNSFVTTNSSTLERAKLVSFIRPSLDEEASKRAAVLLNPCEALQM